MLARSFDPVPQYLLKTICSLLIFIPKDVHPELLNHCPRRDDVVSETLLSGVLLVFSSRAKRASAGSILKAVAAMAPI